LESGIVEIGCLLETVAVVGGKVDRITGGIKDGSADVYGRRAASVGGGAI